MSKMKLSFSLILTIFLVGILSTAAFARGAYWEGISADGTGGFNFKFINTSDTVKDFTVKVYSIEDDYTAVLGTKTVTQAPSVPAPSYSTPSNTAHFTSADVTGGISVGTIYKFELNDSTGVIGVKYGALTDSSNLKMVSIANDSKTIEGTLTKLLDVNGSGLANANHTGMNENAKKTGQKTHGFYQNNTNSCAGCHQTHTGADSNLLMKDGVYSTCSACHDGTTGAYNSFAPITAETPHSIAGTFGVDSTHNGSIHEADGSLKVAAAPGGNVDTSSKEFGQEFDCASCHSPHGNGSLSENNLNLDPLGWGSVQYALEGTNIGTPTTPVLATLDNEYGKLFKNIPIYAKADIPTAAAGMDTPYILVKLSLADQAAVDANYFYKRAIGTVDTAVTPFPIQVIQTYRWNGSKGYVADYSLWLREKGYPYKADTLFWSGDATNGFTEITSGMTVVWKDGFAYGGEVTNITKAQVSLGIDVETTEDIATLYDDELTTYIPNSGVEMSKYCASCHTDYLSATRKDVTGKYTTAHRHQTSTDELTCVRCHFGHGSESKTMKDANDNTYYDLTASGAKFDGNTTGALDYLKDPNPSSALKRYTGMSVCYACHGQGEQFLGNPNNIDRPLSGQPGTEGRTAVPFTTGN